MRWASPKALAELEAVFGALRDTGHEERQARVAFILRRMRPVSEGGRRGRGGGACALAKQPAAHAGMHARCPCSLHRGSGGASREAARWVPCRRSRPAELELLAALLQFDPASRPTAAAPPQAAALAPLRVELVPTVAEPTRTPEEIESTFAFEYEKMGERPAHSDRERPVPNESTL